MLGLPAAPNCALRAATASRTRSPRTAPVSSRVSMPEMKVSSLSLGQMTLRWDMSAVSIGASVPPTSMKTGTPRAHASAAVTTLTCAGTSRWSITAAHPSMAARNLAPCSPSRNATASGHL